MPDTAASRKRQIACFRYLQGGCEHRRPAGRPGAALSAANNKVCLPHSEFHGRPKSGQGIAETGRLASLSILKAAGTIRSVARQVNPPGLVGKQIRSTSGSIRRERIGLQGKVR
jgi:hypothetical protein